MVISKLKIAALASIVVALPSIAQNPAELQGEFELGGPLDHNGSIQQGDSHLYISLSNDAAKGLYFSLPGDPFEDPCTGYNVKGRGNVVCYEIAPDGHFCSFSVNLERNAVEAGLGGCF
ncbi:MAG: hypothetical protein OEQ39_01305 [Gammaproteobacteria bacterium]|nr:hypothetical protein [Gammaproteobacteria bacterium]MDH3466356.1 hypothetical protein [Gammaproteobacteria bacterium]